MTAQEIQKRNEKAQHLRVIQVDESWFYVESDEGKICYKVCYLDGKENYCTCGDFAKGSKGRSSLQVQAYPGSGQLSSGRRCRKGPVS